MKKILLFLLLVACFIYIFNWTDATMNSHEDIISHHVNQINRVIDAEGE